MKSFHDGKVILHAGDCMEVLRTMPADSVDAVVTDPPYHLTSIVKRFGDVNAKPTADGVYNRSTRGFMGKQWDGGDIAFRPELWAEVLRVLKPGGHMVCFGGTRTYHRMVCAIEDAGFEVRDQIAWVYGSGFPKSHDVSKGIDRAAEVEREVVAFNESAYRPNRINRGLINSAESGGFQSDNGATITAPATDAAKQWQGWGTALKPSFEPLCLARKPLNLRQNCDTIGSALVQIWSRLWLLWPVNVVELPSTLNPLVYGVDPFASAQWSAEDASNTLDALYAQMGMSQFVLALTSSLNTVSSWSLTWAESSTHESMFTTETESDTTINWQILNSSLSKITPDNIIEAHKSGAWSNADASPAVRYLNAFAAKLNSTLELSAAENALRPEHTCSLDETAQIEPNLSPICLARKPLSESTVSANVLKHGVGALNIDATRIATSDKDDPRLGGKGSWTTSKEQDGNTVSLPRGTVGSSPLGRWPANLCHDGSPEVLAGFPDLHGAGSARDAIRKADPHGIFPLPGDGNRFGDSGSAARFFYTSKAGKMDRISRVIETLEVEWNTEQKRCLAVLPVDTEQLLQKGIVVSGSDADKEWSTFLSGNNITALCQKASNYTIKTGTNSTTASQTWNWLTHLLINASIPGATLLRANGSNHVENADVSSRSLIITLGETVSLPGANSAVSGTQLRISVNAKQHGHPTVKPVDLIQWLVRLVCPKGATVLDPFAGTGTTGAAAFIEGCRAVLIEREAEYLADIERRMGMLLSGQDERARKLATPDPHDTLPLFAVMP